MWIVSTCKVWSQAVIIVLQETVQEFGDIVGGLVGQQAAGDIAALGPLGVTAGRAEHMQIKHFYLTRP